jgi:hypothetical protein
MPSLSGTQYFALRQQTGPKQGVNQYYTTQEGVISLWCDATKSFKIVKNLHQTKLRKDLSFRKSIMVWRQEMDKRRACARRVSQNGQETNHGKHNVSAHSPQKSATCANRNIQDSTRNCKRGAAETFPYKIQLETQILNENAGKNVPFILRNSWKLW